MSKKTKKEVNRKKLQGSIVSDKMQKTLVVRVDRMVEHPKYKKRYTISKNYKAHYEDGEYAVGDRVEIEETSPVSKHKKWKVIKKIN
ncbi:MAG: 30S ribosomal protein S17 [Candidatus Spechtbacterales bacterium]|nr:30S ribosomal protein S17 [Candidatus Spechtbacterales bacterium]